MSSAQHHEASTSTSNKSSNRRGRGRYSKNRPQPSGEAAPSGDRSQTSQAGASSSMNHSKSSRSRKFGGQLSSNIADVPPSEVTPDSVSNPSREHRSKQAEKMPEKHKTTQMFRIEGVNMPDLTNRLIETLKSPPYADCVICWSPIHPLQPTWACTVSEETNRCCWGVFHNKCIVSWSKKNIQEAKAVIQARNEDKEPEWRCPGCQTARTQPPGPYNLIVATTNASKFAILEIAYNVQKVTLRRVTVAATSDYFLVEQDTRWIARMERRNGLANTRVMILATANIRAESILVPSLAIITRP
ncbi:SubName: Full=Uncharacterized protein {ECO:0000313/EMBL:CCA67476.1} [Serendipita indica DSM 11827]|uniref:RING-type domain-containing protein n=1 Tax=Serendipita indica (strain DSM 11827) TaxID=1109443 RepID=G4T810_SERID|nr:SubName: Full=Uncharacterized protein {ECO:0000313/EMBL:CCA67476.1} [Serendipita indica DSM 11827]CCA67476.1 hypothetical protein PIIN_01305 [Serendipita indica DSM 11827]